MKAFECYRTFHKSKRNQREKNRSVSTRTGCEAHGHRHFRLSSDIPSFAAKEGGLRPPHFSSLLPLLMLPGTESNEPPSRLMEAKEELQLRDLLNSGVLAVGTALIAAQGKTTTTTHSLVRRRTNGREHRRHSWPLTEVQEGLLEDGILKYNHQNVQAAFEGIFITCPYGRQGKNLHLLVPSLYQADHIHL